MRIISFDPSLNNWGIAIWEDGIFIESDTISVPNTSISGNTNVNRLHRIRSLVERLKKYEADLYIAEIPIGSQNYVSAVAFGAVLGILANYPEYKLIPVTPFMVKRFFKDIKENPDKHFIHNWVKERYPIEKGYTKGNHQADAVIVYLTAKKLNLIK